MAATCPLCDARMGKSTILCRTCGFAPDVAADSRIGRESAALMESWLTDPVHRAKYDRFRHVVGADTDASSASPIGELADRWREYQVAAASYSHEWARDVLVAIPECVVLNAAGVDLPLGTRCRIVFHRQDIVFEISGRKPQLTVPQPSVPWRELMTVEVEGRGKVTSGGTFLGGGSTFAGAMAGMAIAGVMNALVRETEVETYLGLLGAAWEVWLLHDQLEPLPLRMELAPVFLELRRQTLGPGL